MPRRVELEQERRRSSDVVTNKSMDELKKGLDRSGLCEAVNPQAVVQEHAEITGAAGEHPYSVWSAGGLAPPTSIHYHFDVHLHVDPGQAPPASIDPTCYLFMPSGNAYPPCHPSHSYASLEAQASCGENGFDSALQMANFEPEAADSGFASSVWLAEEKRNVLRSHGLIKTSSAAFDRAIECAAVDKKTFLAFLDRICAEHASLNLTHVSKILYNAGKMRLCLPTHIVECLGAALRETPCLKENINARQVAGSLYGLQRLGDTAQTRMLVASLIPLIHKCKENLTQKEIGQALWGLRRLRDSNEAELLLKELTFKIQRCREVFDAQTVLNGLRGLESLTDSYEYRNLLAAFAPKIWECSESIDEQEVRKAVCRFKYVSDVPEVQAVVAALSAKITCRDGT